MRISRKKPNSRGGQSFNKKHRLNHQIKSPELRLIDERGENLGVIATSEALAMARDKGLDLVEVSPLANPPVAKIVDYSKLRYQEEKEKRKEKAKQKKIEVKGIRLTFRIGEGDKNTKIKQTIKFLKADDKVKIEMQLRGRERQHKDKAKESVNQFIQSVNEEVETKLESPVTVQGGKLSVLIAKK